VVVQLSRRTATVLCASTLIATLPALTPDASAEVVHLKNGTQVKGKITKQDEENFEMLTQQGILKISKQKVMLMDLPNPVIAAGLGIGFPGAGQPTSTAGIARRFTSSSRPSRSAHRSWSACSA